MVLRASVSLVFDVPSLKDVSQLRAENLDTDHSTRQHQSAGWFNSTLLEGSIRFIHLDLIPLVSIIFVDFDVEVARPHSPVG